MLLLPHVQKIALLRFAIDEKLKKKEKSRRSQNSTAVMISIISNNNGATVDKYEVHTHTVHQRGGGVAAMTFTAHK